MQVVLVDPWDKNCSNSEEEEKDELVLSPAVICQSVLLLPVNQLHAKSNIADQCLQIEIHEFTNIKKSERHDKGKHF